MFAPSVTRAQADTTPAGAFVARPRPSLSNQAMLRRAGIQPRLSLGPVDDPLEREADMVADQVVGRISGGPAATPGAPAEGIQRRAVEAAEDAPVAAEEPEVATAPPGPDAAAIEEAINQAFAGEGAIQRKCAGCEAESAPPEDFENALAGEGSGRPLPPGVKGEMETAFGTGFDGVRIHTGGEAARLSRQVDAQAFTRGQDIYFGEGAFDPGTAGGKHLLAHELTHTLQQGGDRIRRLTIAPNSFSDAGTCGQRLVRWNFSLDNAAPSDGYMVQHVRMLQTVESCPSNVASISTTPVLQFWEAWEISAGQTGWPHQASVGYTDMSLRPPSPGKSGCQATLGTVKFFPRSVTGDLGTFGAAPASPNGGWGPGAVPTSASLPSTATKPSWWDNTPTEGPKRRWASSWWNCCGDAASQFSRVDADPR